MSGSQSLCSLSECKVVYVCLCVDGKENVHVFLCFEHGHVCCGKASVYVFVCVSGSVVCPCGCVTESVWWGVCVGGVSAI